MPAGELSIEALAGWSLIGELALDGSVRPVRGALAMAEEARAMAAAESSCRPRTGPKLRWPTESR